MTERGLMVVGDQQLDQSEIVAAGFLASYRECTRPLYAATIRQWFSWCSERGVTPLQARRGHIEVWARELEEVRGNKPSTVANKLGTVCGMYKYAYVERYLDHNVAEHVRRPTVPHESTRDALTRMELLRVLDLAEKSGHVADIILTGLMGLVGLRVGEALALDTTDISLQGVYLAAFVRREKGNKAGHVPLPHRLILPIQAVQQHEEPGPLVRMRNGERMDRKGASRVVDRLTKAAGITGKRITPHSFRHTAITLAHDAGVLPRDIQQSFGYSSLAMVSYYDKGTDNLAKHSAHMVSAYVEGAR